MTMECPEFIEMIDKYIGEESVSILDRIEFRVHLDSCQECRKAYAKARTEQSIRVHDEPE